MTFLKRLFRKQPPVTADEHYKKALRYRDSEDKKFNLGLAIQHFKEAARRRSAEPKYHCELGMAYLQSPQLAVTHGVNVGFELSQSAKLAVSECKKAIKLKPEYPEAYTALGIAYLYLDEKEKAIDVFQAVLDSKASRKFRQSAERHIQRLKENEALAHEYDEARKHLEQAIAHRSQGKRRLAEKEFSEAAKLSQDFCWLYRTACELGANPEEGETK